MKEELWNKMMIEFKDNRTGHSDIILRLRNPNKVRKFDSYYFILEDDPKSIDGAKERLIKLLKGWTKKVKELRIGDVDYLPISFKDQYLGVFEITCNQSEEINLTYGFIKGLIGNRISPVKSLNLKWEKKDFKSEGKKLNFRIEKTDLLSDLKNSIEQVETQLAK